MAGGIDFDWDDENRKHLAAHKVTPMEFEQLQLNDPVDLDYELRAITAFPAGSYDRNAFLAILG